MLAERIAHERELRQAERSAFEHERELRAVFDSHERELRLANEAAVEKARQLQFEVMEQRLEAMNQFREQLTKQAATLMPIDRWEREHHALTERFERDVKALAGKVSEQESVTVRQDGTNGRPTKGKQNSLWLIGIGQTSGLALLALVLHLAKVY